MDFDWWRTEYLGCHEIKFTFSYVILLAESDVQFDTFYTVFIESL
jgi:hypothetical protein